MNPLGVHALVWTQSWTESDCARAISLTKETGFDFIEVPLLDPAGIDIVMTRAMLESHDIDATCSLGLSFETDVTSDDPTVAARGEKLLNRAVDVTAGIGARYLGGVVHSAMAKYKSPATEEGRARCVDILRRVAERALDVDVTIGIEAVNRYESNIVNTAAQAMSLIDRVNQPNVVVHLDTYHTNNRGE
ncbi:MAG: sugar phosphate isomerase/epimerase family protein [Actinomycetota bacterium]